MDTVHEDVWGGDYRSHNRGKTCLLTWREGYSGRYPSDPALKAPYNDLFVHGVGFLASGDVGRRGEGIPARLRTPALPTCRIGHDGFFPFSNYSVQTKRDEATVTTTAKSGTTPH